MRTLARVAVALLLLALDWAALHDILKANEPDYTLEYGMLAFSLLAFVGLFFVVLRRNRRAIGG